MKKKQPYPLSAEQMSLILGINEATVKMLAKGRQIPCKYINRRPMFSLEKLRKHLRKIEEGAV